MPIKVRGQSRLDDPDMALVRKHDAFGLPGRAGSVEKHRRLACLRHDGIEGAHIQEIIEAALPAAPELHRCNIVGDIGAALLVAEHELCSRILQDEMDLATRKLETDRHRNEAGAHDAEISREKFRPIGGEDRDTLAPRKPALGRARAQLRWPWHQDEHR